MKRYLATAAGAALLLTMSAAGVKAQDIHFSQFYENAILRNPALTGIFSGDYKAGVNYRTQWGSISTPYQTIMGSVESRIAINEDVADYLSFGLTTTYDRAGSISFNSLQIMPAINYNKSIEDKHQSYLSLGFAAAYIQRSVDPSKMTFDNQYVGGGYSPTNASGESMTFSNVQHFDVSAGVSLNSSLGEYNQVNYYLGAAAYHLTKPKQSFANESFIRLNTKWTGQLGVRWNIDNQFGATIHANYLNQAPYQETIAGGLVSWRNVKTSTEQAAFTLYAGCFYRFKDALIPTLKLDYQQYSITMSYDMNTSSLKAATNGVGGFEISLFARGNLHKGIWAKDKLKCPRFEQMMPAFQE